MRKTYSGKNVGAPFVEYIASQHVLPDDDKVLLADVGASGGIHPKWFAFMEAISAVGFDPLVKECERLNQVEHPIEVSYIPVFVGGPLDLELPSPESRCSRPHHRMSNVRAREMLKLSSLERYNSFQQVVFSESRITLDNFFAGGQRTPDFLKIDTDGHDFEVLLGSAQLLKENTILGVCVESQFHGPVHRNANTFSNIDMFMRKNGFCLFDLKIRRYSRWDLPGKFLTRFGGHTDFGQILWADAFYFRDLGSDSYAETWDFPITAGRVIKLACFYELHHLNDCAIELIKRHRALLENDLNVEKALSLLVPPMGGRPSTQEDYERRFKRQVFKRMYDLSGDIGRLPKDRRIELKQYDKLLFFGAGGRLRSTYDKIWAFFKETITVKVTDNDKEKWGGLICDWEIIPPEEIVNYDPDIIVVVSTYAEDILMQLFHLKAEYNLGFRIASY
jgi:FkbM family methyltransferase